MNVVVTGGGTIAPVDDVRLLTNVSSGRLAAAITEAFLDRGASVWHIHAPSAQLPLKRRARFALDAADPSAELDRLTRLRQQWLDQRDRLHLVPLENRDGRRLCGDARGHPRRPGRSMSPSWPWPSPISSPSRTPGKLSSESESLVVRCRRTPKVIRSVRDWAPSVYLVGFKLLSNAPDDELIRRAEDACRINRADLTVANDLQTLRQGRHTLHLVRPGAETETLEPGDDLADRLVARIIGLGRSGTTARQQPRTLPNLILRPEHAMEPDAPATTTATTPESAAPDSAPEAAERIYFPELDGLRFVAFLMVFLFHGGLPESMVRAGHRLCRRPALARERRVRRPALLHPERLPDRHRFCSARRPAMAASHSARSGFAASSGSGRCITCSS